MKMTYEPDWYYYKLVRLIITSLTDVYYSKQKIHTRLILRVEHEMNLK